MIWSWPFLISNGNFNVNIPQFTPLIKGRFQIDLWLANSTDGSESIWKPSKDKTVSSSTLEHDFNRANGQFTFDFDFFQTSNFREIQQDPTFMVGQQINFGSKCQSIILDQNFWWQILEIWVTDSKNVTKVWILSPTSWWFVLILDNYILVTMNEGVKLNKLNFVATQCSVSGPFENSAHFLSDHWLISNWALI